MLITVREASASPLCFFHHSNLSHLNSKPSPRLNKLICRASFSVRRKPNTTKPLNLALPLLSNRYAIPFSLFSSVIISIYFISTKWASKFVCVCECFYFILFLFSVSFLVVVCYGFFLMMSVPLYTIIFSYKHT